MKRSVPITLLITAVLLLLLFAMFGGGGRSKSYDWKENYKANNKSPYGTHIINNILKEYYPSTEFKNISSDFLTDLPEDPDDVSNYVFIGEAQYLDSADVQQLLRFVANGNNVFISSKSLPYDLMFYVYFEECGYDAPWDDYSMIQDTLVNMNFYHQDIEDSIGFDYKYIKNHKTNSYRWNYIDSIYFCEMEAGFMELGTFDVMNGAEYVNFAKVRYIDPEDYLKPGGNFYFHTNPLAFTNFQMLDEVGKEYAERVFSHLEEGNIYWDSYSQVRESFSRRLNQTRQNYPTMSLSNETPLKYVLGNRHLSWAWYTMLTMGLLYLMFRAKRRQRIIPVEETNSNTSLEFISTIGALYYNKKNHKKLCQQKMKIFLAFIRNRYGISTKKLDKTFITTVAKRSGIGIDRFNEIINYYNNISKSSFVSDETLKSFHREIEDVYKLCK
jgi:hypothetical protein